MVRKFIVTVDLDNAAFAEDAASELSLVLYETARRVADGVTTANIRDVNGNTVGSFGLDSSTAMSEHVTRLGEAATAVIAGLLSAPEENVNRDGIIADDGTWQEIREAFPVALFRRWAARRASDGSEPGYWPDAGY